MSRKILGYLLGAGLAVSSLSGDLYAQQKRDTLTVYRGSNGSLNVGINGRNTNITAYANGLRAEAQERYRQAQNVSRNYSPPVTATKRPNIIIVAKKR